jgi:hypothetical protein
MSTLILMYVFQNFPLNHTPSSNGISRERKYDKGKLYNQA